MLFNPNIKIVIIMVGLPARGKSYISYNLAKYFRWNSYNVRIFNLGDYRRDLLGGFQDHTFFDDNNLECKNIRNKIAYEVFDDLCIWLSKDNNHIAIYDATNTTKERREYLLKKSKIYNFASLFIESICDDKKIIENNLKMKLISKDYFNKSDKEYATKDFNNRLKHYEKIYEEISDQDTSYIKLINNKKKIIINNVYNSIGIEVINYINNLRITTSPIYLSRHGESEANLKGLLGGNSFLSKNGKKYINKIDEFFSKENGVENLRIFTSILNRTVETASKISKKYKTTNLKILNEINAGICEGLTYEQVKEYHPEIYDGRKKDKFNYRYPDGESYKDIVDRVKPFILETEKLEKPVLIISHNAITRVIYSYLMDIPQQQIPHFDIPLHTIIKLIPTSKGYKEERIKLL